MIGKLVCCSLCDCSACMAVWAFLVLWVSSCPSDPSFSWLTLILSLFVPKVWIGWVDTYRCFYIKLNRRKCRMTLWWHDELLIVLAYFQKKTGQMGCWPRDMHNWSLDMTYSMQVVIESPHRSFPLFFLPNKLAWLRIGNCLRQDGLQAPEICDLNRILLLFSSSHKM